MKVNNGQSKTLTPGVYEDISISSGATVTFNPGVYIISPTKNNQGFKMSGGSNVTGNGVMFYITGSNYLVNSPGYWDAQDDAQNALDGPLPPTNGAMQLPSAPDPNFNSIKFANFDANANGGNVNLTGITDSASPYNGILFFQRRRNTNEAQIQSNAGTGVNYNGIFYAKWANFKLSGGGIYNSQFVVGSMSMSGQADITIRAGGRHLQNAKQVFLVE